MSGRTYPVEVRYRPYGADDLGKDDAVDDPDVDAQDTARNRGDRKPKPPTREDSSRDLAQAICEATDELSGRATATSWSSSPASGRSPTPPRCCAATLPPAGGDRGAAAVRTVVGGRPAPGVLFAHRPAHRAVHQRRRDLADRAGIRYVIDPGTARISRYSPRTKVQRLPIEPISQASAGQRAGRCGRVADGICIRLYSAEDFAGRPEYTDPEIARTSLASVILQMASLELGDIASFPFLDPPDSRQITDGLTVLGELGALDRSGDDGRVRLTSTGRSLAALPLDPRLARMIVEADTRGCLADVLVITSALAIQDVREYPLDDRERASAAHARFADPKSDFLSLLNLWNYLADEAKARSGNAFRRMCRTEYLHYLRIRSGRTCTRSSGRSPAA